MSLDEDTGLAHSGFGRSLAGWLAGWLENREPVIGARALGDRRDHDLLSGSNAR